MSGKLYIVATPIGNLDDITFRAINTLKSVDFILCEDTRVTQKILNHYEINTKTLSYHQHSSESKVKQIEELLNQGKNLALVTDAGTPGISDPGNLLIADLLKNNPKLEIIPVPGASAIISILSISGFPTDKFVFLGFIPQKNKRKKFLEEIKNNDKTTIFYESCHRIKKCILEMNEIFEQDREIIIGRELTKKFETIYRGTIKQILDMEILDKGEFVIIVKGFKN
ncbi:MAG: 16S rRNA (cytidine(1402)-2'-O)-methyltransferase [Patescibacteria group bacterium]